MRATDRDESYEERLRASEERLRLGEIAGGIATFEYDYDRRVWSWSEQAAPILGMDSKTAEGWEKTVFPDDLLKVQAALEAAKQDGNFYVEFRARHTDKSLHWIAAKGQIAVAIPHPLLRGAIYEITDRKALEVRLLALNETLEARIAELRQEAKKPRDPQRHWCRGRSRA